MLILVITKSSFWKVLNFVVQASSFYEPVFRNTPEKVIQAGMCLILWVKNALICGQWFNLWTANVYELMMTRAMNVRQTIKYLIPTNKCLRNKQNVICFPSLALEVSADEWISLTVNYHLHQTWPYFFHLIQRSFSKNLIIHDWSLQRLINSASVRYEMFYFNCQGWKSTLICIFCS